MSTSAFLAKARQHLAVGLVHYPVYNKNGEVVATCERAALMRRKPRAA